MREQRRNIDIASSRFLRRLTAIGVKITEVEEDILRMYMGRLFAMFNVNDAADIWIAYTEPAKELDDHLMLAGMTEFTLRKNTIVFGCNTAQFFSSGAHNYTQEEGIGKKDVMFEDVRDSILEVWNDESVALSFVIPVNIDQTHWGAVYGVPDLEEGFGTIYWDDSLGFPLHEIYWHLSNHSCLKYPELLCGKFQKNTTCLMY